MRTITVNLYGGPGAGKTTAAWEIAAELKKAGVLTEYVPEHAKELVWDGKLDLLDGSYENQKALIAEQAHRIDRLQGKVSVIVTDSPILLGLMYQKEEYPKLEEFAFQKYEQHNNFDLFVHRGDFYGYEQAGRIHTPAQSASLDSDILLFLKRNCIPFSDYKRNESYKAVVAIQRAIEPKKHNKNHKFER